jgi:hypothetical protein
VRSLYFTIRIIRFIYLSIYRPFCWILALFQFLNRIHSRQNSLDGGSARRKVAIYTQNNTNTEKTHTDIHVVSGIRIHDPSVRASKDSSCLRPRGDCDRQLHVLPITNTLCNTNRLVSLIFTSLKLYHVQNSSGAHPELLFMYPEKQRLAGKACSFTPTYSTEQLYSPLKDIVIGNMASYK